MDERGWMCEDGFDEIVEVLVRGGSVLPALFSFITQTNRFKTYTDEF